jgi:hypothetical protein
MCDTIKAKKSIAVRMKSGKKKHDKIKDIINAGHIHPGVLLDAWQ